MPIDYNAYADTLTLPTPQSMVTILTNAIATLTLGGKEVVINNRTIQRTDLPLLEASLALWKRRLADELGQSTITYSNMSPL